MDLGACLVAYRCVVRIGVAPTELKTPRNILQVGCPRRNDGPARVLHDLALMEREGTGFDLIYDRLLTSGRAAPTVVEAADAVRVTVPRRVLHPGVLWLFANANERFQLNQRERIALPWLASGEGISAAEFSALLAPTDPQSLRTWVSRLIDLGLIAQVGRTKATRYFVPPQVLRSSGVGHSSTLSRVQPHRRRALILEDLRRFPNASRVEIHARVGLEIHAKALTRTLRELLLAVFVGNGMRAD